MTLEEQIREEIIIANLRDKYKKVDMLSPTKIEAIHLNGKLDCVILNQSGQTVILGPKELSSVIRLSKEKTK